MGSLVAVVTRLYTVLKDHCGRYGEVNVQQRAERVAVGRGVTVTQICHATQKDLEFHSTRHHLIQKLTTQVRSAYGFFNLYCRICRNFCIVETVLCMSRMCSFYCSATHTHAHHFNSYFLGEAV